MRYDFELHYTDGRGLRTDRTMHATLEGAQSFVRTYDRQPYPGTDFEWYSPSEGFWFTYCDTGSYIIRRITLS